MYLNGTKSLSLFTCLALSLSLTAKEAKIKVGQGLSKPLSFIENKGQVMDQENHPRFDIQYKLSTPGMNLYVGQGKLFYQFRKTEGSTPATLQVTTCNMGVTLVGANPDAKVVAADKQEYYENYYLAGHDNGFTVHSYNKVIYKNVYPNIDWVLYVKDDNVEYDFVVRPGGDAANIKMVYEGASKIGITADGSLSAETPMGSVKEKRPYAYETGTHREVASAFKLKGNEVSFETGAYKGSLTIDPYLLWATYFGGVNEDVATSVKQMTTGLTFVGGYTASAGLGTGAPAFQTNHAAGTNYDAFLIKYTAAGVRSFATYYGGTGSDLGMAIAIDNTPFAPVVYLAGYTNSAATGLVSGTAYHNTNNGGNDGFLIGLSSANGARTFSTFYGGAGEDFVNGVACDAGNNVYITGQTSSPTLISTGGAYQTAISGSSDAFVAKFSTTGAIQWSTYFGGTAQDQSQAIACDGLSNVIITGQTSSVVGIASGTAFQPVINGTNDAFVAKFSTAGAFTWGTYFGGEGQEQGNGIAVNPSNNSIAVVGNTSSLTAISSAKAYQPAFAGGLQDAFLAYFDATGAETFSTYYGGTNIDYGQAVCFDQFNNIAIAGGTFSTNGISTTGSYQPAIGGDYDAYMAKFNVLGQRLWGTYFGKLFYDYANAIACDLTNDQLIIAGYTASNTGIATTGTQQTIYGGGTYDGFSAKFKRDTLVAINQPFGDTLLCAGSSFNLFYTANFNFQPGNTFTVQLSNAAGSFAAPVSIGLVTSSTSGSIPCILPAGLTPGTGYRVRIVASNPAFTSPDDFYDINIVNAFPHTTATASTPVCVGGTLFLYDSSPYAITSYSWVGPLGSGLSGAGFTAFTQNAANTGFSGTGITLADAGTYSVITTHRGCPNDTSSVAVVVNSVIPPTPAATGTTPGCEGSDVNLYGNSDTSATVIYSWSGPGGFTSSEQNPVLLSVTSANAGTYTLTDTLAGCPSAASTFVLVVSPVNPVSVNINVSPNDTVCAGTLVTFTASSITGGVSPSYQWMTDAGPVVGAVSSTWSTPSLLDGENVYVIMHSGIICPSPVNANSNVITMNVLNTPPLVNISASTGSYVPYGASVTFSSYIFAVGIAPTYQWSVNGIDIAGATSDTYVLASVTEWDTVTVTVRSTMACAVPDFAQATFVVHPVLVGVTNIPSALDNVDLFPNPNNGSFTIKGSVAQTSGSAVSLQVNNLLGQVIYSGNAAVVNNELNKTIDLSNIPNGIYMMTISGDEGQSKILRFTVQH